MHMRMGMLARMTITLMRRGQRTGTSLAVPPVVLWRAPQPQVALLQVGVVPLARGQRVGVRVRPVNHLPYFRVLVGDVVGELGLLEAGGRHALVPAASPRRGIGGIQAGLDQSLARFGGDHGLEFARGEGVDVAGFGGDQEHHLGTSEGGEFVGLFHNPSFPFRKRRIPSQFVLDILHLDLHSPLGLFPVTRWRFLGLHRPVGLVNIVHSTSL